MRKNLVGVLISVTLVLSAFYSSSFNVCAMDKEEYSIVGGNVEITDTEELIQRAKAGIDEFKENTGMEFSVICEDTDNKSSNAVASQIYSEAVEEDPNIETYKTSQYLGEVLDENGKKVDLYAAQGIVAYSDYDDRSDTKTNGGCTITTTIYFQWAPDVFGIKLLRSTATLSGTLRPSSLKMENRAEEGWVTDYNPVPHINSRTISLPSNGTYTLNSPYSGYVYYPQSFIMAEDTVSFGDGGVLKTHIMYSSI